MLIRICLIVAILAAAIAGALNIVKVRETITTLMTQRDGYHTERDAVQTALNSTNRFLAKTLDTLKQTQGELADTKTERDHAVKIAADQTKKADDLATKLATAQQERDDAQDQNLKSAQGEIEAMKEENTVMLREKDRLQAELDKITGPGDYVVKLPPGLRGKILVVDPKWDFVVLDVGADQGVLTDGELLVSREGKLVAKVIVTSMQKDRCIANIVPGWKLGEMIEGDEVTPAHPAS
jgi:cell shape-determining protein MreC